MRLTSKIFTPNQLERITLSIDSGRTNWILVSSHRPKFGKPIVAAFWKREDEQVMCELLATRLALYWFNKTGICDLSQMRVYGFELSASGQTSQFQAVDAHKSEGELRPIILPPLRFLGLRRAAFEQLYGSQNPPSPGGDHAHS